jgi:hypothetical protein
VPMPMPRLIGESNFGPIPGRRLQPIFRKFIDANSQGVGNGVGNCRLRIPARIRCQ